MTPSQLIHSLSTLRSSAQYLSLHRYRNRFGEVSNFTITFHVSYKHVLENSIAALRRIEPKSNIRKLAKIKLLASYEASLPRLDNIPLEERDDATYDYVLDENHNPIKGVKVHRESGELYLYGLVQNKVVLEPGEYKEVNHSMLTKAKIALARELPIGKWRQFRIGVGSVESVVVGGKTMSLEA